MTTEIPKQYDPHAAQQQWYSRWEAKGYFNANADNDKPPHTIMIPLPNVTGALHMGHALNGTLQDLITRWRRMQGHEALWMPGTDHAGIATQAVVERRMLEEEGITRHDIGREALVNRIWRWKDAYEGRILDQLKSLGASCDWRRVRFTLDEVCSRAVRRTFFKFFRDGLIYRGKRLVNWDTHLQTAVADDEVYDEEIDGHFWTFSYPVVDENGNDTDRTIAFSTTRPETMLGDTAVCVHPHDERYADIVGKQVRIPVVNRLVPIIADGLLADRELGTGAVKVTPAHDPNDYACYQRNPHIGLINILNPDGTINENGGEYEGQDRYLARQSVVEAMEQLGHFLKIEDRRIPIKHSDRSKTTVEPYLSDQWFVKMDDHDDGRPGLAQLAIDAVTDRRVKFYPQRYAKTCLDWLGEKRDWCISRQLWWGHRIPIWSMSLGIDLEDGDRVAKAQAALADFGATCEADGIAFSEDTREFCAATYGSGVQPGEVLLLVCVSDGHEDREEQLHDAGFVQDPDVLDTWFSSALWPHATLGWPDESHNPPLAGETLADASAAGAGNAVLKKFYPGNVLVTSRDIITLWVARMVLAGLYNMGDIPFSDVCIHPKILDGFGQTMSKSKGNGVDPLDLVDKYGVDAVRFTITSFAGETQDVRLLVGYECPHCGEVIPQTLDHQKATPSGGAKPRVKCANKKCGKSSQFSSPWFEPDEGEQLARVVSERFEYGQKFCNKLWNACRFALLNLEGYTAGAVADEELQLEDRWILSRLSTTNSELTQLLSRYQFDAATRTLRDFTWNEFCDWYLEMIKPRLRDEESRPVAQRVLVAVLDSLLRMLGPFTPFVTEELWQRLAEIAPERGLGEPVAAEESIVIAKWPESPVAWQDTALEKRFETLQETIVAVRNVRAVYSIPPSADIALYVRCDEHVADDLGLVAGQFGHLAKSVLKAAGGSVERPPASASFTIGDADGYIPLEGLIDRDAELDRQNKEADKLRKFISGHEAKLNNEGFVSRAPEHVVADVRETLNNLKNQLASVEEIIRSLGDN